MDCCAIHHHYYYHLHHHLASNEQLIDRKTIVRLEKFVILA